MKETVLVLGSGPIRIGQGIEFDYSCVHCVWALEAMGYRAITINNNPETVSTDFDTGDGLYFEPVTAEDVMDVIRREQPIGAVVQFGGQTAINLAERLAAYGVQVLGTSPAAIAAAEDRDQFDRLLTDLGIPKPAGRAVRSKAEALTTASEIGYPVLVRPSFVLGGRAMEIIYDPLHLDSFYAEAEAESPGQPVLIDKYIQGREAEVDVISDGIDTFVPGIMEHIESAGVHSGDSMAVYPPVGLTTDEQRQMVRYACAIARKLNVRGLMNIQFVIENGVVYVLEVNPRASRTVPYLTKVTGIPMVDVATRCMMGVLLADMGYHSGIWVLTGVGSDDGFGNREPHEPFAHGVQISLEQLEREPSILTATAPVHYAVKAPVFSFLKLSKVDATLGPEMKSTGEIMGVDRTYEAALYKAMVAAGLQLRESGYVAITVRAEDRPRAVELARAFSGFGYPIVATEGTRNAILAAGLECDLVLKIHQGSPNLTDMVAAKQLALLINTSTPSRTPESEAALNRRACIDAGVPCLTSLDTAEALVRAFAVFRDPSLSSCLRMEEYLLAPV